MEKVLKETPDVVTHTSGSHAYVSNLHTGLDLNHHHTQNTQRGSIGQRKFISSAQQMKKY